LFFIIKPEQHEQSQVDLITKHKLSSSFNFPLILIVFSVFVILFFFVFIYETTQHSKKIRWRRKLFVVSVIFSSIREEKNTFHIHPLYILSSSNFECQVTSSVQSKHTRNHYFLHLRSYFLLTLLLVYVMCGVCNI
jgi:uncharacterized integral membrane protein